MATRRFMCDEALARVEIEADVRTLARKPASRMETTNMNTKLWLHSLACRGRSRLLGSICVWAVAFVIVMLPSCAPRHEGAVTDSSPSDPVQTLHQRAAELWEARSGDDWAVVFRFQEPQEGLTEDGFIAWCEKEEPFRVHSFQIGDALIDGDMGWVEVDSMTAVRRFANMPPREVHQWEKWRLTDGTWYPVPRPELESYPISPALRDAAEEARLLARFEQSWEVRSCEDWEGLYELVDPADRLEITLEEFAEVFSLLDFLSCKVRWVEVVGELGNVRAVYRHKVTDPSLTKLLPETVALTEGWIKRENVWYLDLKRP